MINHGTNTTIKVGCKTYKEYFNVANVKYYDAILRTPYLKRLGIILDFTSLGEVHVGN